MSQEQKRVIGAPDHIVLVVGDIPEGTQFNDLQEVCWCADSQLDTDIEYVRADLRAAPPAPVSRAELTDEQIAAQDARYAIDGAITYGRTGTNKPPVGHWLTEYWGIGRQLARLGETSAWDNQTSVSRADWIGEASGKGIAIWLEDLRRAHTYLDVGKPFFTGKDCAELADLIECLIAQSATLGSAPAAKVWRMRYPADVTALQHVGLPMWLTDEIRMREFVECGATATLYCAAPQPVAINEGGKGEGVACNYRGGCACAAGSCEARKESAAPVAQCEHDLRAEYAGQNGARAAICAKCHERVQTAAPVAQGLTAEASQIADLVWLAMRELPDRNSPEDEPDACVCTITELRGCVDTAFERIAERAQNLGLAQAAPSASPAVPAGWKIQPDEEGWSVVSPSGDGCYLFDIDSRHGQTMEGAAIREVLRQLCSSLVYPDAAMSASKEGA